MPFLPFQILGLWFRGLLSIAILAGGIYLLKEWYDDSRAIEVVVVPPPSADERLTPEQRDARGVEAVRAARRGEGRRVFHYEPGWNRATAMLAGGVALLAWATLGRVIGKGLFRLTLRGGTPDSGMGVRPDSNTSPLVAKRESKKERRRKSRLAKVVAVSRKPITAEPEADEDPRGDRTGEVHTIKRPDGSVLRVECYGPPDAPPIVFTHGWGCNSTEWFYPKRHLAGRFRLIVWDEPGLGLSKKPDNNDYRLENLAADLEAVLALAGNRPAVLVGHSIGGMITLTFCKVFTGALRARVAGLVLAHTSYTNPVRTTQFAAFYTAIEKPVLIPLMHLTIATWPLMWLMNLMSYLNGSLERSTHSSGFCNETRGQLDFATRFAAHGRPDVLARGMLGMIRYDATDVLGRIDVPTLVFVGDRDATTKPEAGQFIARNVPGAELVTLSPAKHMGLVEHHERFDQRLAEFADACQEAALAR